MCSSYIKSPLNYMGNKYKILNQIIPLLEETEMFVDLFMGTFNVGINSNSKQIIGIDNNEYLVDLLNNLNTYDYDYCLNKVFNIIESFNIDKYNEENYYKLRDYYNQECKDWSILYVLCCYSFNCIMRFNKKGDFNVPFGKSRTSFNNNLQENFKSFVNKLKEKEVNFYNQDFSILNIDDLCQDTLVYCDPPYLITEASYNKTWDIEKEKQLLNFLDYLHKNNIKFALSNVIYNKNKTNELLIQWMKQYNIHYLDNNYNNCFYNVKDKKSITQEVLITNY